MWSIRSVQIVGSGFLSGLDLKLPDGLICIIGPRGSGKTTLAEAIRYVLTGIPADAKGRQSLLRDNLGSSSTSIEAHLASGERYVASRSYPHSATLASVDGRALDSVQLERGSFLPIDAFSSREIEDIADESLGGKRRALLDSLETEQLREIELSLGNHRRALESNADQIRAMRQVVINLSEQIEELTPVRARLAALPQPEQSDESTKLALSARRVTASATDVATVQKLWRDVEVVASSIKSNRKGVTELTVGIAPESPNSAAMHQIVMALEGVQSDVGKNLDDAALRLLTFQATLTSLGKELVSVQEQLQVEHQKLVDANAALGQTTQLRAKMEQDLVRLDQLEAQRQAAQVQLDELLLARRTLKATYVLEHDRVSDVREAVAARLQQDCGKNVRLRVLRNADDLAYQQTLLKGIAGSGLRGHDELITGLSQVRPDVLAQILHDSDAAELENLLKLGSVRTAKLLEGIKQNLDALDLEVLTTDDRISIELNVGSDKDPIYRDAADLSRGQKCTALLPLLLARRDSPLLIDQPEDNLDNHFIYETVVDTIRRLRSRRQMIFVTHNANIPVLGEADLVVVMDSDGKRGYIHKVGSLDDCREEIVDLLEGGREAFELRSRKYGQ